MVGVLVSFGFERGAELMWPHESPWVWWGGAAAVLALWLIAQMLWFKRPSISLSKGATSTKSSATANGKETAKRILRASSLAQAQDIFDSFSTKIPASDRYLEHFANKAYMRRHDDAGEKDAADAFYRKVASKDKDSVRDDIEFALMVEEARRSKNKG